MRLGREVKLRSFAPTTDFDILFGTMADRNARVWNIWNAGQNLPQASIQVAGGFLERLDLLPQFFGLCHRRSGVLSALLQLRDVLGSLMTHGFASLSLGDRVAALGVNIAE